MTTQIVMDNIINPSKNASLDDIFNLPVEQGQMKIELLISLLGHIKFRAENDLKHINFDLVRVGNWRLELPYDQAYNKSKNWLELNKLEIQLRSEKRQVQSGLTKNTLGIMNQIIYALVEHRKEHKKQELFKDAGDDSELEKLVVKDVSDVEYR